MNESDVGQVFLFAVPWDWTVVGRFVGHVGDRLVLHQAGYFTRTGATFDRLCKDGFGSDTRFHPAAGPEGELRIPNQGLVFPWAADWPQGAAGARR